MDCGGITHGLGDLGLGEPGPEHYGIDPGPVGAPVASAGVLTTAAEHRPPSEPPQQCALKFLITNSAAGSIIGKGGATITQLQEQSTAKIKVANSNDYFPGTNERCVLVTGTMDAMLCAASLVIMKIQEAQQSSVNGEVDMSTPFAVKMLVPNASVGAIIGKGGATIHEMSAQCGAQMKVSSKDQQVPTGVPERIVSVNGNLQQMNHALNLIVAKMQENPANAQYQNATTSYMRARAGGPPTGAIGAFGAPGAGGIQTMTIGVLDSLAGYVVGKEGNMLREIQRQSVARIQMSRRGEYIPGTTSRSVTITGSVASVQMAHVLISQKIQQAAIQDVSAMAPPPPVSSGEPSLAEY